MKNKLRFLITVFVIVISTVIAAAQEINGRIHTTVSGYQNILVPQEFRSIIGNEVGKLRIRNSKGESIPFIKKNSQIVESDFNSVIYSLTKTDSSDILIIENSKKDKKNSYTLKISNSANAKNFSIEGSDNQENWFNLVSKSSLQELTSDQETFVYKAINFPLTSYKYIRLSFNNKSSSPIQILNVGEYKENPVKIDFVKLKNTSYTIQENSKEQTTNIEISKNGLNPVELISFYVTSKSDFFRPAYIYSEHLVKKNKRNTLKNEKLKSNYFYFDLASNQSNVFQNSFDFDQDKFYVVIENDINKPLQIDSIVLFQQPLYIIADLTAHENYTVEADKEWQIARYDIDKLNLKFSDTLRTLTISDIQIEKKDPLTRTDSTNKDTSKWILIFGLIVGILVIFYFGRSLIKDMQKNK